MAGVVGIGVVSLSYFGGTFVNQIDCHVERVVSLFVHHDKY